MGKKFYNFLFLIFVFSSISAQVSSPVKWSYSSKFISTNTVELTFKANIDSKFHIYGAYFADGGPIPTSFHFDSSENILLSGKVLEKTAPVKKHDTSFDMDITIHSNTAVFVQIVKLKKIKPTTINGYIEYMACTDDKCLPPVQKEFKFDLTPKQSDNKKEQDTISQASNSSEKQTINKTSNTNDSIQKANLKVTLNKQASDAKSLLSFFILALIAGLAGVITPCVFPMIPMTVSFFLQGNKNKTVGILRGSLFGVSIILIYTLIGVLVSFTSAGAGFANELSSHWIPNLIFFMLFIVFGASFLGMFEIVLPGNIVNKADQQADKGGYLGVIFLAIVTVLVSFSCTGPIVGALLVEAAGGVALKPILGMFGFGLAFALPFTFFAIFPTSLKSLPKSGGWLNSVKVVLGLLMLALSLKFLVNIDQSYHFDLISRELFLSIWIVIAIILGIYLLGKIYFAHDSKIEHITVPRLLLAMASFVLAVYLSTGFANAPLSAFSSFMPPMTERMQSSNYAQNNIGNLCETPKYNDLFHLPYGLNGYFDYKQGMACAAKINKPIFFDFKGHSCGNCKEMEAKVWSNPEVQKTLSDNFVIIALYTDDRTKLPQSEWLTSKPTGEILKTIGKINEEFEIENFQTNSLPLYVIADAKGKALIPPIGLELNTDKFITYLKNGIQEFNQQLAAK